jgi:protein-S-isoprenylcysteine O-methyltransferase Ste14
MPISELLKKKIWPAAWGCFGRLFTMLGLPLLAWGMDDPPGFFSNPARTCIAGIVILKALLLAWIIFHLPERPHQPHDPEHWHYTLLELGFILSAFGDRRNVLAWAENPTLRWIGVGIYLAAALYFIWANLTWLNHLTREAENAVESPTLISEGPYQWTRYPTLLSVFFYSLGFALAFRSWVGLAFLPPLAWVIVRRAHLWDRAFAIRFKQAWGMRCQTSKRLIPYLF